MIVLPNVRRARATLIGVSAVGLMTAAPAWAQQDASVAPGASEEAPMVVPGGTLLPNAPPPAGILDNTVNITGVGQVVTDSGGGFVGTCTGTLINPRTVIFAAHCVNTRAASAYGAGGTAVSVGFQADNLGPLRRWLGLDGGTLHTTDTSRALYNVEQVWYDPRSLALGPTLNFLQADIALATLDTPAFDIPTWAVLFSELTGEVHARVNGYGSTGNGTVGSNTSGGFRRRAAENMLSLLASLNERNQVLFGSPPSNQIQSLYHLDFDSPGGQATFNATPGRYDFDVHDGAALPREGITGPGDSGGPLIVDQKFAGREVVAGVLSGGSRFYGGQPFGAYGTTAFYQPLFLYWDTIVANNSYAYVTNNAGAAAWEDASHWVQTMDPNYVVEVNGQLVNALPGTLGLGVSEDTAKFGKICFLDDCVDMAQFSTPGSLGTLNSIVIAGGPGSTNFVPNNVKAVPAAGVKARYYDVTLAAQGTTTLSSAVTIDRLTIDGPTSLSINAPGALTVLGDFTQIRGATSIDGAMKTGEALIVTGALGGFGRIDPTFLTVVAGGIVPGSNGGIGTFSIVGDLILSSGATVLFDVNRLGADLVAILGDTQNAGVADLGGTAAFQLATQRVLPRAGQKFTVLTAAGGLGGSTFDRAEGGIGILRPTLSYTANSVVMTLTPGSFSAAMGGLASPTALAFGNALDAARASSYTSLSGVYGMFDIMDIGQLSYAFEGLAPRVTQEAASLDQGQAGKATNLVADRLSVMGTDAAGRGRFTIVGAPQALGAGANLSRSSAAQLSFVNRLAPSRGTMGALPETMSGFIAGGYDHSPGASGERSSWHMAMGLEMEVAPSATLGTAFAHVDGRTGLFNSQADASTNQAAVYGSYRLGGGAYVGGLASLTHTRLGMKRGDGLNASIANLNAETEAMGYSAQAEAGVNLGVMRGLTLTPRAALRYNRYALSGYSESGGDTALAISDLAFERIEARLGATLSGQLGTVRRGWTFTPELKADLVTALNGGANSFDVAFAAAPDQVFALPFASQDRAWGEVKAGFRLAKGPLAIGAGLEGSVGRDDWRDDRAVANVSFAF